MRKKMQWGDSKPQAKRAPESHIFPGSCVVNEVKMKPEGDWMSVERRQNPRKHKAPSPSPEPETKCSRNCLK